MTLNKIFVLPIKSSILPILILAALIAGCGQGSQTNTQTGGGGPSPRAGASLPFLAGNNVMALTVNGGTCSSTSYPNKPCVSVTICQPGTSNCQTINDILLDTGSFGLRLFKQAISVPLTPVMNGQRNVAECVQFGDGSSEWGPVAKADVVLANEPAVTVPIHVVDATFVGASTKCPGADAAPANAGFNGILGTGLFKQDCGAGCVGSANNGLYYACDSTTCAGTTVSLANQVSNPVAFLPVDNNGVIVELPSVPEGGVLSISGFLVLGIGTQANNTPDNSVIKYAASAATGEFLTTWNSKNYNAFLDTGSNGLFFTAPSDGSLPGCSGAGWFCPGSTVAKTATIVANLGITTSQVSFSIGNMNTLASSGNNVFVELGGATTSVFDWGLPFFVNGRFVYVGIEGTSSSLGTGPYWGF